MAAALLIKSFIKNNYMAKMIVGKIGIGDYVKTEYNTCYYAESVF